MDYRKALENLQRLINWGKFPVVIEVLTLVAVVWYASIAHKQWGEMIRSNGLTEQALNETKKSNTLTQRAWIVIPTIDKMKVVTNKPLKARMHVKNVGHLPAIDVGGTAGVGILPVEIAMRPHALEGGVPAPSLAVIAPGEANAIPLPIFDGKLSPQLAREIIDKKKTILLFGRIAYTDPLKTRGETKYCAIYDVNTGTFSFCAAGNSVQ